MLSSSPPSKPLMDEKRDPLPKSNRYEVAAAADVVVVAVEAFDR
jgi:hypothetical protein